MTLDQFRKNASGELFKKHFGDRAAVSMFHPGIPAFFSDLNDQCITEDAYQVEVLKTGSWTFGQTNMLTGGLSGQITKCKLRGIIFYTRENVTAIDGFQISAAERWGDKIGKKPRAPRQSLELLVPGAEQFLWDHIAAIVKKMDTKGRPVLKSLSFDSDFLKKWEIE